MSSSAGAFQSLRQVPGLEEVSPEGETAPSQGDKHAVGGGAVSHCTRVRSGGVTGWSTLQGCQSESGGGDELQEAAEAPGDGGKPRTVRTPEDSLEVCHWKGFSRVR